MCLKNKDEGYSLMLMIKYKVQVCGIMIWNKA